jgi:hypothetical protein
MKQRNRSYRNEKWYTFSEKVKKRDDFKCLKCERNNHTTILQTHHKAYRPELEPWEYPLSDCITLCKGCHAREHGLIEPEKGWTLISIDDLGDPWGTCEKKGCGTDIRYEHLIYHPQMGYLTVGSTCVDYLTQEDQFLSKAVLKIYKKITDFIDDSTWEKGVTKNGKKYYFTTHSNHQIRIFGDKNYFSFQIALKLKGEKWFEFGEFIRTENKTLSQVKELGFIVLKGKTSEDEVEKKILRNIYKNAL